MQKTTIELTRIKGHWAGYGIHPEPFAEDSDSTLGAICAWTARPENAGQKVYRHVLRRVEERVNEDGPVYRAGKEADEKGRPMNHVLNYDIPSADLVYYLDIYHQ